MTQTDTRRPLDTVPSPAAAYQPRERGSFRPHAGAPPGPPGLIITLHTPSCVLTAPLSFPYWTVLFLRAGTLFYSSLHEWIFSTQQSNLSKTHTWVTVAFELPAPYSRCLRPCSLFNSTSGHPHASVLPPCWLHCNTCHSHVGRARSFSSLQSPDPLRSPLGALCASPLQGPLPTSLCAMWRIGLLLFHLCAQLNLHTLNKITYPWVKL